MWKANGKMDLPLADRERPWDGAMADKRVRAWAGGPAKEDMNWPRYRTAFFASDDADKENFGAYKLGFADVIDGELRAVPRGIFACAGGRGVDRTDIPEEVRAAIRTRITRYYRRMAREFDDDGIVSPFKEIGSGMMERKTVTEYHEVTERVVTGFPSILGNVDDGGDLIVTGAYAKTLQERGPRIRWLWQHNSSLPPIAKILEMREVGRDELPEPVLTQYPEATGALFVKREYLDTPRGDEVLTGIRAGAVGEMSIGYDPVKVEFPEDLLVGQRKVDRILQEIRLWELSDVNWGMNDATMNLKRALDLDAPLTEIADRLREAGRWDELAQLLKPPPDQRMMLAVYKRRLQVLAHELDLVGR